MKKAFLSIFACLLICWGGVQYWPVKVGSIQMPLKDKKRLEFFFRETCFLNVWAYTLLGRKPMSIDQYTKPWYAFRNMIEHPDLKDILLDCFWPPHLPKIADLLNPRELRMKWGWETLNKYFTPNSHFYLGTYENNDTVSLLLVNKPQLVHTVKQHIDDFQPVLTTQAIHPDDLFDNEKLHVFLKSLHHEALLGTLLGYGRENAWLFYQYKGIEPNERPMNSAWVEEEPLNLEQLNTKTYSFQSWDLSDLFYPRFACDPDSEETKQLKQIYQEDREKIVEYYQGKDLVEATLSILESSGGGFQAIDLGD